MKVILEAIWNAAGVKKGVSETTSALDTLKGAAAKVGGALGIALSAASIVDQGRKAIASIASEETALAQLAVTARNVGRDVPTVTSTVSELARVMQDNLAVADDDVIAGFNKMLRASRDYEGSLKNVSLMANVAAGTESTMAEAGNLLGLAMAGNVRMLQQLVPQLRAQFEAMEGTEDATTRARMAMDLLRNTFAGAAAAEMGTFAGKLKNTGNALAELRDSLVQALHIDDAAEGFVDIIRGMAHRATNYIKGVRDELKLVRTDMQGIGSSLGAGTSRPLSDLPAGMPVWAVPEGTFPDDPQTAIRKWLASQRPEMSWGQGGVQRREAGGFASAATAADIVGGNWMFSRDEFLNQIKEDQKKAGEEMTANWTARADEIRTHWEGTFARFFQSFRAGWKGAGEWLKDFMINQVISVISSYLVSLLPGGGTVGLLGMLKGGGGSPGPVAPGRAGAAQMNLFRREMRMGW